MRFNKYFLRARNVYIIQSLNTNKLEQQLIQESEEIQMNIPVCGGNFVTPVGDQAIYVEEIHYNIGSIKYIENAD